MADVITRFKLETTQYDSKLRDAAKGLVDYTRVAKQAGDEMGKFTKDQADAARALGNITTSATNSKDKVKELVSAFNDVAKAYNALTDKQKESDFGKAMAESLNTLKGRIRDAKQEMNSTGGIMEQLAQKFTINFDAIKLMNVGLKATETALKVAKDAFFASEANVDEWGRTMQAAEGVYEGFLNALNTGDISGYLSRIDDIVNAARAAYNELDRLGTMKTIQGPQMSAQQTENERMRMMIQTGRYIAPLDGRRATMQNGQLLTPEQIRRIEQQLQNGMQKVVGLVGNEVKQTGKAIDAYYNSLAKQNGMTLKEFKKGTSSMAEYDKRMEGYRKYQEWNDKAAADYYRQGGRNGFMNFDKGNPYLEFKKWGVFRVDKKGENSLNDLVNLIKQRDQQTSQAYSTLTQSYRAINRAEGITVKKLLGGGGGGKGGTGGGNDAAVVAGSIGDYTKQIQELRKAQSEVTSTDDWQGLEDQITHLNVLIKELKGELKVEPYDFTKETGAMVKAENEAFAKRMSNVDKIITDSIKKHGGLVGIGTQKEVSVMGEVSKMAGGINSIASGIEALGVELPEDLKNVLNGLQGLISIVSGIATVVTAIQSIQTAQMFKLWAGGGIVKAASGMVVPGSAYGFDGIPSLLTSGELVLNRAQQGVLAGALEGGAGRSVNVQGIIRGQDIVLVADRWGRVTGKGELLFGKNL